MVYLQLLAALITVDILRWLFIAAVRTYNDNRKIKQEARQKAEQIANMMRQ